ncbi:1134_t:CDS:2 [Funneliformis caledonium]|uniref:1134_t:CDS:1 n=1 Tax=Funneliformis caledonium TaxID=1117310 RepID=A0A9N8YQI6_9GLOM|nr:1134_t:CDS:2 [Funneliformis caledonium]
MTTSITTETNKFIKQELSNVLKEYDYGVIPNSIKILPTKSLNPDAHQSSLFQLTLLENIKLIITIAEEGYIITEADPVDVTVNEDLECAKKWINKPFETMEALLLAVSPKFGDKFHQALFSNLSNLSQQSIGNITNN